MGKNLHGGSKHKSMASKHSRESSDNIRIPIPPFEKYAVVTKVLGGGSFEATFVDEEQETKSIRAILRGSMKGFNKRFNFVQLHSFIMIAFRDFQSNQNTADIIHVFQNSSNQSIIELNPELHTLQALTEII
jgi:AAA+ ATPase superfamily predicted ATPase